MRLFGDPILLTVADPVPEERQGEASLSTLVRDMLDTMDAHGGVGLAANQVGIARRVFVFDCEGDRGHILNPTWEPVGAEKQTGPEGCLSIPDIQGEVERWETVRVQGATVEGNHIDREVSGLLARCVQHETDHLNGILFLRHLAPDQRKEAMGAIRSSEWFKS